MIYATALVSLLAIAPIEKSYANTMAINPDLLSKIDTAASSKNLMKLARFAARFTGVIGIAELAAEAYYSHVLGVDYGTFALDDLVADTSEAFSVLITSKNRDEKNEAALYIESVTKKAKSKKDKSGKGDTTPPDGENSGEFPNRDRGTNGGPDDRNDDYSRGNNTGGFDGGGYGGSGPLF